MKIVSYGVLFALFVGFVTLCFIYVATPTHRYIHQPEIIIPRVASPTEGFMHLVYRMTPEEAALYKAPKKFFI